MQPNVHLRQVEEIKGSIRVTSLSGGWYVYVCVRWGVGFYCVVFNVGSLQKASVRGGDLPLSLSLSRRSLLCRGN